MDFALMTEPQVGGTYDDLLRLALWAEDQGLVAMARSDHYMDGESSEPATDALATLAGLARETTTIKLGVLVTPITFRHPAIIAKTASTIDQMSGGRLELGIGTGWMASEHERFGMELGEVRDRFSRLYETLAYVSAAFGRTAGGYRGRHYALADIEVLPRPTGPLPIIVGGGGAKKTPTMAGTFADEYNLFSTDPEVLAPRIAVMRAAAGDAGRDPHDVLVSVVVPDFLGGDDADYRDAIGAAAAARGIEVSELEDRLDAKRIPHGPAERLADWCASGAAMGIGRVYIQEYAHLATIDTERLGRVLDVVAR